MSLLIPPPQIAFVKGRFVTDRIEPIAHVAQSVRLFPQELYLLPSDNEKTFDTRVGLLYLFNFSNNKSVRYVWGALYSFYNCVNQANHPKLRVQKAMGRAIQERPPPGKDIWGRKWNARLGTCPVVGRAMKLKSSTQAENSWQGRKSIGPNKGANPERFSKR